MASKRPTPIERPLGLPTVEDTTQHQMAVLLSTANILAQFVLLPPRSPFNDSTPERPELDGGVKCAVENALTSVCQRIESITNDPKRWNVQGIGRIEKALVRAINADEQAHLMQALALENAGAPHVIMRAAVGLHRATGQWVCVVPDSLMLNGEPLVGQGSTPEEACADFNRKFYEQQAKPKTVDPKRTGDPQDGPDSSARAGEPGTEPKRNLDRPEVGTPPSGDASEGKPRRKFTRRKQKPDPSSDV